MARLAFVSLAAALLVGQAVAQEAGELAWTGSRRRINDAYPERAAQHEVSGQAAFDCQLAVGGALSNCRLLAMKPDGYAFDQAGARALQSVTVGPEAGLAPGTAIRALVTFKTDGRRYQITPVLKATPQP